MDFNKFITFPLHPNSKVPAITGWQALTSKKGKYKKNQNIGILCGSKNDLLGVDIDYYKIKDDKTKKIIDDFIKQEDTLTIQTPKGGYHLYFKFDEELSTSQGEFIDIRSNGGFLVKFGSEIDGKKYSVFMERDIKKISSNFKEYLMTNQQTMKQDDNQKTKTDKHGTNSNYEWVVDKLELETMLNKLDNNYLNDFSLWMKVSSTLKFLGFKELWESWSKQSSKYNKKENEKHWKTFKPLAPFWLFKYLKCDPKWFYKPIETHKEPVEPVIIEPRQYLGTDFLKPNQNYIIKSDTGTGKTTSFNNYIKQTNQDFISIVSRIELGREQSRNLKANGVENKFYKNDFFECGDNIICCADSLIKFDPLWDFEDYVIFIDEFNSFVEYILSSETDIKNNRREIFQFIVKALSSCKQFILVDADISALSLFFIKSLPNVKFNYIINPYQKYKGVPLYIYHDENDWFEMWQDIDKQEGKFFFGSDSKATVLKFKRMINFYSITSDDNLEKNLKEDYQNYETDYKNILDRFLKMGVSPAVVYGLDSILKRRNFHHFKCLTITPPQMIQQIARNRNPIDIHVYFSQTKSKYPKYDNLEQSKETISKNINHYFETISYLEKTIEKDSMANLYYSLLARYKYKMDSYNSNKYLHFIDIAKKRGFEIKILKGSKKLDHSTLKRILNEKYELQFNEDYQSNKLWVQQVAKKLNIPWDEIENFSEFFIDPYARKRYFNYLNFFKNKDYKFKLENEGDFVGNKMKNFNYAMTYCEEVLKVLNIDKYSLHEFNPNNVKKYDPKYFEKTYKAILDIRRTPDLSKPIELYKTLKKIFNHLYGDILESHRIQINGEKYRIYKIKTPAKYKQLIEFSKKK